MMNAIQTWRKAWRKPGKRVSSSAVPAFVLMTAICAVLSSPACAATGRNATEGSAVEAAAAEDSVGGVTRGTLDPKLYWFHEAMGNLKDVRRDGATLKGSYIERQVPTSFTMPASALEDPLARGEGYKLAVRRMLAWLHPGAVSDNAPNREYLLSLRGVLTKLTGQDASTPGALRSLQAWFDENAAFLIWSPGDERLVVPGSSASTPPQHAPGAPR